MKKIYENVCRCGICGAPANRVGGPEFLTGKDNPSSWHFECSQNPAHMADGFVSIWTDLSYSPAEFSIDYHFSNLQT